MNRANGRHHGCRHDWPNARHRLEDLPFPGVLHNAYDLGFQLFHMLSQESEFYDQLSLFQDQASLPTEILDTDALLREPLQFN